jgi:hypothetical protein
VARRKALQSIEESVFTEATLAAMAKDLKSRRLVLDRTTVSDDLVVGLRALITKDGVVTYHANYHLGGIGGKRGYLRLGTLDPKAKDHISLDDARELTKTIKTLSAQGIDPEEGLHARLVKELLRDGTDWRPDKITTKKR